VIPEYAGTILKKRQISSRNNINLFFVGYSKMNFLIVCQYKDW